MTKYEEPHFDIDYNQLRNLAVKNFAAVQEKTTTSSKENRISGREKITITFAGTGLGRYAAILGNRATAGVLISYYPEDEPPYDMLMDPGCRVQERLRELGCNFADLDVVLFTHAHYDHFQQKDQILEGASGAALVKGKVTIISNRTCLEGSPEEIPEITKYQRSFGPVVMLDPYQPKEFRETVVGHGIKIEAHKSMHGEVRGARKVNSYIFNIPTGGKFIYGNISEGPAFKDEKGEWLKGKEDRFKLNESLFEPFIHSDLVSVEVGPFTCTGHKLWENHCAFEGAETILSYLLKRNSPLDIFVEKEWGYEMTNILEEETRKHFETLPLTTFSEASAYKAYDTARNLGRKDIMVIDAIDKTQVVYYPDTEEYSVRFPVANVNDAASFFSMITRKVFPTPLFTVYSSCDFKDIQKCVPVIEEGKTKFVEFQWKK